MSAAAVLDVDEFLDAAERVCRGASALDPQVVSQLLTPARDGGPLAQLSPREREVLALMAEGRTRAGIPAQRWVTEKTVETHVGAILGKLGLPLSSDAHRRVLAVLTYLVMMGEFQILAAVPKSPQSSMLRTPSDRDTGGGG